MELTKLMVTTYHFSLLIFTKIKIKTIKLSKNPQNPWKILAFKIFHLYSMYSTWIMRPKHTHTRTHIHTQTHTHILLLSIYYIPYSGKVWRGETLANLANCPQFTKLKSSKLVLTINNLLADLLIRQTFFHQMLERVTLPNFPPAKLSRYMVTI